MAKYSEMLKLIRERFERYQTYYQILTISPINVTDEIVKEAYDKKIRELEILLADCEQGYEEIEEIETIMRTAFEDAYNALKDEDARKHYQDILNYIEEHKEGEER